MFKNHHVDIEKARREMAKRDIDVLVSGSIINSYYVTGYWSYPSELMRDEDAKFAVIPRKSEPFVLAPDIEIKAFTKNGIFKGYEYPYSVYYRYLPGEEDLWLKAKENIKEFEKQLKGVDVRKLHQRTPALLLAKILNDRGLGSATIGIDKDRTTAETFEECVNALPSAEWKDGSEVFTELRMIKSPEEIDYVRAATKKTEDAIYKAIRHAREGAYIKEQWDIIRKELVGPYSDDTNLIILSSPLPPGEIFTPTGEKTLRPGQIMRWDVGCNYHHYRADVARHVVIGEIPQKEVDLFNTLLEAADAVLQHLNPGVKGSDLYRIAHDIVEKVDPQYKRRLFNGHGVGLEQHELPYITPWEQRTFEPGMTISIEIPHYTSGGYSWNVEDMYLVTEEGYEWLSNRLSRELIFK
jgi:Xaa-Pro aminopeptidase